jgi:predicted small lipoprotein YifL
MLPQLLLPKALLVAALLTCLSGCGNTGDLYLPIDAPATQGTDNQPTEL